jgi:hypothetical protein
MEVSDPPSRRAYADSVAGPVASPLLSIDYMHASLALSKNRHEILKFCGRDVRYGQE